MCIHYNDNAHDDRQGHTYTSRLLHKRTHPYIYIYVPSITHRVTNNLSLDRKHDVFNIILVQIPFLPMRARALCVGSPRIKNVWYTSSKREPKTWDLFIYLTSINTANTISLANNSLANYSLMDVFQSYLTRNECCLILWLLKSYARTRPSCLWFRKSLAWLSRFFLLRREDDHDRFSLLYPTRWWSSLS